MTETLFYKRNQTLRAEEIVKGGAKHIHVRDVCTLHERAKHAGDIFQRTNAPEPGEARLVEVERSIAAPKSVTISEVHRATRKHAELDQHHVNLPVRSCRLVEVDEPGMPLLIEQHVAEVRVTVTGNARCWRPHRFELPRRPVEPHETRAMFAPKACEAIGLGMTICIFLERDRSEVTVQPAESSSGVLVSSPNPAPNRGD